MRQGRIEKTVEVGGDKSISHRALMFSALAKGSTKIKNFLTASDTLVTLGALRRLGVRIEKRKEEVIVSSTGRLVFGGRYLNMGESGTSMRLLAGILAAAKVEVILKAAPSLQRRPMSRITIPLRQMQANIFGRRRNGVEYPPLVIRAVKSLRAIDYRMPQASAQVKSAIIFAALKAKGRTYIHQPFISRDHTERMLKVFGGRIRKKGKLIEVEPSLLKTPQEIFIPADFSSAAYFLALALLRPKTCLRVKRVGVNPTRSGLLRVLKRMGAKLRIKNRNSRYFEPYADIEAESSSLKGVVVKEEEIPLLIDELPLVFVLAAFASSSSRIYGLRELRVKETDRIHSLECNLKNMGVEFKVFSYRNRRGEEDFYVEIKGGGFKKFAQIRSFSDHRTAMSMAIGVGAQGRKVEIDNWHCVGKSFPDFREKIKEILGPHIF